MLGTLKVGKSQVQAAERVNMQQVPLTGYEDFWQELQTYPMSREPVMVQPTASNNTNNSALLDLPNVNTNLPPPLTPQQTNQAMTDTMDAMPQSAPQVEGPIVTNSVSSNEILESIQSIAKVMQEQLIFSSKTAEQGIIQNASLFQEMIKTQEKRDLDPAVLAIPTFLGEAVNRPQCLDWVSRVKNVCDKSGRSFRQELINKSGILVQNFIRSLNAQITNKELTEKVLQFFSNVPTISHALNKLQLIPIVNYNQCYQNLVERVEGCELNSITSMVAMEIYLGSVIEPIRKSVRDKLYFNNKHAPKTLSEAMQKAQDLHIKHLYAMGEDQQGVSTASSDSVLPEITVNEVNTWDNRSWYRYKCQGHEGSDYSRNSWEMSQHVNNYSKKVTFD